MNWGLVLISPIVLVRLLTVEAFGNYREFLLYVSLLSTIAAFGVNSSLMYFVPRHPEQRQRFVNQALCITLASSASVIAVAVALDLLLDGALIGEYLLPTVLYVALFVNFDFWEHLWLSQKRIGAVFGYTTGRLIARLTVVITAAALTRDVHVIVWSLVGLETVRLLISALVWARHRQRNPPPAQDSWAEQLRFCMPVGAASALVTLNASIGGWFIAKMLGPVGLAHYAIGTYVQPIITVLRNSLSDVLLPEMAAQPAGGDSLSLWRRMTIAAAIMLIAAAVVLASFAHTLVVTLFSEEYLQAVPVFQIYLLVLIREVMDFAVPLRAINNTRPLLRSNFLGIVVNAGLLLVLLGTMGVVGAAVAYVVSRSLEGLYLGRQTMRAYSLSLRKLALWTELGKVAAAAAIASLTLNEAFWTERFALFGVVLGSACFFAVYGALLIVFRVQEVVALLRRLQKAQRVFVV